MSTLEEDNLGSHTAADTRGGGATGVGSRVCGGRRAAAFEGSRTARRDRVQEGG